MVKGIPKDLGRERRTVLVLGAGGQLGWEVCRQGNTHSLDVIGLDLPQIDITDRAAVQHTLSGVNPSLVVNAAAYTAVDRAESEPELAFAVNRDGPGLLASLCSQAGIPLMHISTDYVFSGEKGSPYVEGDPVSPLGVYGKSKAAGEEEVRGRLREHLILRTSWLYGVHGNNFVKTMLRLAGKEKTLRVVEDQSGCPTFASDLAGAVLKIADLYFSGRQPAWGTYHYCGQGATSWHGFAEEIVRLARRYEPLQVEEVRTLSTKDYPTPARRPANSAMDCSLLRERLGINTRSWQDSLAEMMERMFSPTG